MRSWRNLPPALVAMFALSLASILISTVYDLTHEITEISTRFDLAMRGFWLATDVLEIFGALVLARRLTGLAATGLRVVAAGAALGLANMLAWDLYTTFQPHWDFATVTKVSQWISFVIRLVPLAGLAVAAAPAHRRLVVAVVIVALVTDPLPTLAPHMFGWITSWKLQMMMYTVFHLAWLAVFGAVALALAPEPYPAPPSDAAPGFHAIAAGLWLRVIAAVSFAGVMLLVMFGKSGDGAFGVFKLATISVAVVNAISFFIVARGALTLLVRDVPPLWATLGAVANLWCLGVTVAQLPSTYHLLYGLADSYAGSLQDHALDLSVAAPLVAVAAIAMLAAAIAGFAANRGLDQLRAEAQSKGVGFVILMVAAIAIQEGVLPEQTSEGSVMFFLVAAAVCALFATAMMARLCTRAADSLHAETPLPTATLRS